MLGISRPVRVSGAKAQKAAHEIRSKRSRKSCWKSYFKVQIVARTIKNLVVNNAGYPLLKALRTIGGVSNRVLANYQIGLSSTCNGGMV